MKTLRLRVTGRVQGVGFRHFTRDAAARLGLDGWVRNRLDGSVEAVARGDAAALDAFRAALRQGPPASRVDDIVEVVDDEVPAKGFFQAPTA
ncbi:acylphosphatase [Zavarzinia aquatilis]|uniref:Acylphosphatase n=1 Tax=Zavarzinia aquatilis TaxID=2211142 RepID=A0A317E279_9PROT|nr:acylphosphatase [Zavarzinia aquatilis]PWR21188.1 acylphosphatase [Zavarzinia aquatilis]